MMDASRASTAMFEAYQELINGGGINLVDKLAEILDNEFQQAEPTLSNIDITTPAGTLKFDFNLADLRNNPWVISQAVAEYWSKTVETTGVPVECDEQSDTTQIYIDSVTNDAMKIVDPLANAIIALADGKEHNPPYYDFFNTIFEYVRTIEWTVVEKSDTTSSSTTDDSSDDSSSDDSSTDDSNSDTTETCEQTFTVYVN